MRQTIVSLIFVVFIGVWPAFAQPEPLGKCFLDGKEYTPGSEIAKKLFSEFAKKALGAARMAA